ncbi:flotillin family protein [Pseudogracilibacillus sp. SO30301A]|uniref:flotillin family protein n=1 Tax=Pseudogracilibacillus sp. SO30301A TaxID=3098291 RepID=UPI00300E557C
MFTFIVFILVLVIIAAVGGVAWFIYMKIRYKTVPSNMALIITGPKLGDPKKESNIFQDEQGRSMKVIRGGGHRLRMFQTHTPVSLTSFQLQLKTPKVYTLQGVGIFGEAVATVKVADTLEGIVKYAEQFLGKKQKDIEFEVSEVLGSNLRAILSKMTVEQINSDRESFNEQVREVAQSQLDNMGFKITSLGLTNIKDDEGYLENLGRPKISEIKKEAEIAESTNNRQTKVHVAQMNEEVAKEQYAREINIAEARKEKEIKDAQILAVTEREKAKSEAAYLLEQEERNLEIEKQRLMIVRQDREENLKIKQLEEERQVKLEQEKVKVRREKADAAFYEQLKAAEAEAESRLEAGKADAEVIRLKSAAEIEAIEKRAEALNKHKEVMLTEMIIKMLPEYASAVADPLSKVESIRILDGGKGDQVTGLPKTVTSTLANLQESVTQMTGLDLDEVLRKVSTLNKEEPVQKKQSDDEV